MKPLLIASGILALGVIGGAGYALGPLLSGHGEPAKAPAAMAVQAPAVAPGQNPPAAPVVTGSIGPAASASQPTAEPQKGVIYRSFNVDQPYIALTFDDGPNAESTPRLLSILKAHGIKATFFVLGNMAAKHPEVLKMIADDGHEIGNHTWSHPQLTRISVDAADRQIGETSAVVEEVTGKKTKYLRPPYGSMKPALRDHIEDTFGITIVNWSVDPLDWKHRDSQVVYDEIMKQVKPGAIILSHDIYPTTVDAMERVLDELIAKGYKFGTISELIAMNKAVPVRAVATMGPKPEQKSQKKTIQKPQQKPHKPQNASTVPQTGARSAVTSKGNLY